MNIELLQTLIILAQTKNFSRTAETLFVSQPTVTARINQLEEELGSELFYRGNKGVTTLTVAGEYFLEYAKKSLAMLDEGKSTVAALGKYKSTLKIAAPDSIWQNTLITPLNEFMRENPYVAVDLLSGHSEDVVYAIEEGLVDMGASFWKPYSSEIEAVPLFESKYTLVGAPGVVPEGIVIDSENFYEYKLIYMDWGLPYDEWFRTHFHSKEFFLSVERVFLFISLLLDGRGIGFLSERNAKAHLDSGALVRIPYKGMEDTFSDHAYILFNKKNHEKISPFLDVVMKAEAKRKI